MTITSLNHINIRTDLMEETKDFYVDIVGLTIGFRPDFDDHGYWLYAGDSAIVHLSPSELDSAPRTDPDGMGNGLDHIGLFAAGVDDMKVTLAKRGIKYHTNLVSGGQILQEKFNSSTREGLGAAAEYWRRHPLPAPACAPPGVTN